MKALSKQKILVLSIIVLLVSLACGMPYGIGFNDGDSSEGGVAQVPPTFTPFPTDTPVPTPTNTATHTSTPEPTPTATRVVLPTNTPTAVSGASGVGAQLGGDPTAIAETAIAGGQPVPIIVDGVIVTETPAPPPIPVASTANVIVNGGFEDEWPEWQGHANGWTPFAIGNAHFGWYKDTWFKVVLSGKNAQLIEIINDQGQANTYAGIYQTVPVVAGAEYELIINGLVRSDEGSGGGYVMQYGLDHNGGTDPLAVTEWVDLPFPEHHRTDPNSTNEYNYGAYSVKFKPAGSSLTLFIRGWKKWADNNEGNWDIDDVSLRGTGMQPTAIPTATSIQPTATPVPATATPIPVPTNTPIPMVPDSGGQLNLPGPPMSVLMISLLLVFILASGAVWGVIKRKAS